MHESISFFLWNQNGMFTTDQYDFNITARLTVYMNLIDKNSSLDYDGDFHSGF